MRGCEPRHDNILPGYVGTHGSDLTIIAVYNYLLGSLETSDTI